MTSITLLEEIKILNDALRLQIEDLKVHRPTNDSQSTSSSASIQYVGRLLQDLNQLPEDNTHKII